MRWNPVHGYSQPSRQPIRKMIAEDIGLSLLVSPWDPDLLAVGIKAPRLTGKQKNINVMRGVAALHRPKPLSKHAKVMRRFNKTAAGKAAKREVSAILQRMRYAGECRG